MSGNDFVTIHEAQPSRRLSTPDANRAAPLPQPQFGGGGQQTTRAVEPQLGNRQHYHTQQLTGQHTRFTGTPAPRMSNGQYHHAQRPSGQHYHAAQQPSGQHYHAQHPSGQHARPITTPAPQQQQPLQYHQQQLYISAAAPIVAQPNAVAKISDLKKDLPPTAEEAREALTEYHVVRFTKAEGGSGYESDGSRKKPSWSRVLCEQVPGISKHQAAKTILDLNQTTIAVLKKKATLSEDEQRQIEKALQDLQQQHDDAFFVTTLVQLDDHLKQTTKEKDAKEKERAREREKERKKEKHRRAPSRQPSKSNPSKKVISERVSLTAYFKRAPRSDVDPIAILQCRKAQRDAQVRGVYAQPLGLQGNGHYAAVSPRSMAARPENFGASPAGALVPVYHPQSSGQGVTIVQPASRMRRHVYTENRRRSPTRRRLSPRIRHGAHSPSSTDESDYSEIFTASDDETAYTSPSSASSDNSYERLRTVIPSKPIFRESQEHYGLRPSRFSGGGSLGGGAVHIQPHRSVPRGGRQSVSGPNHPFPHHQANPIPPSPPGPGTGFVTLQPGTIPAAPPIRIPQTGGPAPVQIPPPPPPDPNRANASSHGYIPPPPPPTGPFPGHIPPPPPDLGPHHTAVDPRQIYDKAYADGRADTREEAIAMAERIAERIAGVAAAAAAAKATESKPVRVIQTDRGDRGRGRDRSRSWDRRSRDSSWETDSERSGDRNRRRRRTSSRDRRRSLSAGRRASSRERGRDSRDGHRAARDWHVSPARLQPPSGVRLVRPADGYTRPRVGMDRAGLDRDMGRLRLWGGEDKLYSSASDRERDGVLRCEAKAERLRMDDQLEREREERRARERERDGLGYGRGGRRDSGV